MKSLKSVFNHFAILEFFPNCTSSEICFALASRRISSNISRIALVLHNIRRSINVPMIINSGYRDDVHNRRVGGVPTSQHLSGSAVDVAKSKELVEYFTQLLEKDASKRLSLIGIYQLIEYDTFYHISTNDEKHDIKLPSSYIDKRSHQLKLEL